MKIRLVCVGKLKEKYFVDAVKEYEKRLSRFCTFEIVETEECYRGTHPSESDVERIKTTEGARIAEKLRGNAVLFDRRGKEISSEELAEFLKETFQTTSELTFVIGGSYGVGDNVSERCKTKISFGKITYPHQLMRVIACEQIYRAFMINANAEYHK